MIDVALSLLAPDPCLLCGKLGAYLCHGCKYNISSEPFSGCVSCGRLAGRRGICGDCKVPYRQAWSVGERADELLRLIDRYKFERARSAHTILADLMATRLPELPAQTVVVPVPTIASHIRQRGYDHTLLLARHLARLKGLDMQPMLARASNTKQRGASRTQRVKQAQEAFRLQRTVDPDVPYLLIDDVVTTGATLKYAAKLLADAGAKDVWVAVLARQISTD